jgi:Fe2+ or Zn2+ uptake regulation protein
MNQKLYRCIKNKKIKHSQAREAIFQVLQESEKCLMASEIADKLVESYPKKISTNTIYRHLNLFVDCELVLVVQDDFKRAYYTIKEDRVMVFRVCLRCNAIKRVKIEEESICNEFKDAEFITIHKRCQRCHK